MKIQIGIVILHYIVINDTIECVESIQKNIDTQNYQIVVVDNASPNASGKLLIEKYKENDRVTVIGNEENIGFARGNNVGIKYIRQMWEPEFVILLNNDVILLETELSKKIKREYEKSMFSVLGPLIITKDGRCDSNPIKKDIPSVYELEKRYRTIKIHYYLAVLHIFSILKGIKIFLKRAINDKTMNVKDFYNRQENVQLHGSFLVLSQRYFERFEGLDSRTFLYMEEDILYASLMREKMKTVYLPEIIVFHKEDVSTDAVIHRTSNEKFRFTLKCQLDSLKVYMELLKEQSYLEHKENLF